MPAKLEISETAIDKLTPGANTDGFTPAQLATIHGVVGGHISALNQGVNLAVVAHVKTFISKVGVSPLTAEEATPLESAAQAKVIAARAGELLKENPSIGFDACWDRAVAECRS